jgi:hypothetical protein
MRNEFQEFPKIARLSREVLVTEKIDGSNGCVFIEQLAPGATVLDRVCLAQRDGLAMYVGSRSRWITPEGDNFGFAAWCVAHADELFRLGPGRHFGEWWGSGIQRGYGLTKGEKRWSLFNVLRWHKAGEEPKLTQGQDPRVPPKSSAELPACCDLVPMLWRGTFDTRQVDDALLYLREHGSQAAPGFMKPEGVVVFHVAGGVGFKKTIEKDSEPKGLVR